MDRNKFADYLCEINSQNNADDILENEQWYLHKFDEICEKLECSYDTIITEDLSNIISLHLTANSTVEWKYILISFYILKKLNSNLESCNEILSVQQSKNIRRCINNMVKVGISTKLLPSLPFFVKKQKQENEDLLVTYNIQKCTTVGLIECLKLEHLRLIILPDFLRMILVSLYQMAYCPLKKDPSIMTPQVYERIIQDREQFVNLLVQLRNSIHPSIYVKETMIIMHATAPSWFRKRVSQTLTCILRSNNGVENTVSTLLNGTINDITQSWKVLEVCTKLIVACKDLSDFKENICKQVVNLLQKKNISPIYERFYVHLTKTFYGIDSDLSRTTFIKPVLIFFLHFSDRAYNIMDNNNVTNNLQQNVRLLHSLFLENSSGLPRLPVYSLKPIIYILFRFYCLVSSTTFTSTSENLKGLLTTYLTSNENQSIAIFDSFLFGIASEEILAFRDDLDFKVENKDILINISEHKVIYSPADNSDCIIELIKSKNSLSVQFFSFLLNCISKKDKYFKKINEDLLGLENEMMNEYLERNLVVYKMLSELAADKNIQKEITEKPEFVIDYIRSVLSNCVLLGTHKSDNGDSEDFHAVFTILMILQSLVKSSAHLEPFKSLIELLRKIHDEVRNDESKQIIDDILKSLGKNRKTTRVVIEDSKTELDKILEELSDPLLPVRAHALMMLSKLVERKHVHVIERKQYVLNMFQHNLKEDDSYLYLSAIGGLTAMADVFPDTVLNILCEEFSDTSRRDKEDGHEIRMKLGECLMRATRLLGDMAPKYKPLLLNTFLLGAKDEDDLIRASSLSNLGEICKVLGYKLGSIITEVLVCVHAIICTDKSPQARRAAVTVLRQLFIGLDTQMIDFLKDDILPIYRSLKEIYQNDKDEVMRLQAQLALEELNENVKKFVFPSPQLSDKKIVMLN